MKSVTFILCVALLSLSHASHGCSLRDANWNLIPPIAPDGEWRRLEVMEVSREKRAASLADVYPVVFSATV